MRKLILFGCMLFLLVSCENEPGPEPSCSDGIQNGTETGVDCGGDCIPCLDCTSDLCAMLSGALSSDTKTSKTWESPSGFYEDISERWQFSSNGVFFRKLFWSEDDVDDFNGYWKFDDPESPEKIELEYTYVDPNHPRANPTPFIFLFKLTQDTLIMGSNENQSIYTPED